MAHNIYAEAPSFLNFLVAFRFLDKEHSTGSTIWCCFPQCRAPVCVISVTVKSATGLKKTSRLSMSKKKKKLFITDGIVSVSYALVLIGMLVCCHQELVA